MNVGLEEYRIVKCKIGRVKDWISVRLEECEIGNWKSVKLEECEVGRVSECHVIMHKIHERA